MGAASIPEKSLRAGALARGQTATKRKRGGGGMRILLWVAVAVIVVFCLFPFYWLINVSLKWGPALPSAALIPPNPTLRNYESIFNNADFTRALLNSAIVSLVTTALAITVGSFAAYALARLRFKRKFLLLAIILSVTTFPQ